MREKKQNGKHLILQTNDGYFYKLPLNKFEEFKMSDAEIEKLISEEQEFINQRDEESNKNIRKNKGSRMWTATSNMDRMVPIVSSMVRMVPGGSHMVRMVPMGSSMVRMIPMGSSMVRMIPMGSGMVRMIPNEETFKKGYSNNSILRSWVK
jgi:hypothetical protein